MKLKLIALTLISSLAGCASSEGPKLVKGFYYYVGDPSCRSFNYNRSNNKVDCFRANGAYSDSRAPMTGAQMQAYNVYLAQQSAEYAQQHEDATQLIQQLENTSRTFQQIGENAAKQSQSFTVPTVQSYQRPDGTWVYCTRTSSYTVHCRTQ